jgi:type IV secretory pathway VirB10-like protein
VNSSTDIIVVAVAEVMINNNNNNNNNNNTRRQKCCAKGSGKEVEIQEFMHRDTTNVEPEIYDYTSYNWSHWNSNQKLKEKFGSGTR